MSDTAASPDAPHELRFDVAPGVTLAADAYGDPSDPPAVLLHGGGQTRHSWAGTAQNLARDGWHAISVDLRGHGESSWAPDGRYGHEEFSSDVVTLAKSLPQPPVLIGASLGGIASLLAVGLNGAPASALVLVDIATRMEPGGADRIIAFMREKPDGFESLEEVADSIARYNPHRPRPKDLGGLRKNLRLGEDGRYRWHWDPAFLERGAEPNIHEHKIHDADLLDRAAAALRIPTLLVRGRKSDLLSEDGAREFLRQVPHARYADVSGAGHMVAGDRNDLFTDAVLGFLRHELRGT